MDRRSFLKKAFFAASLMSGWLISTAQGNERKDALEASAMPVVEFKGWIVALEDKVAFQAKEMQAQETTIARQEGEIRDLTRELNKLKSGQN